VKSPNLMQSASRSSSARIESWRGSCSGIANPFVHFIF
jgi:hypothetical protein